MDNNTLLVTRHWRGHRVSIIAEPVESTGNWHISCRVDGRLVDTQPSRDAWQSAA